MWVHRRACVVCVCVCERESVCVCVCVCVCAHARMCVQKAIGRQMERESERMFVLFVGCLSSQQHASVSEGRICTDNLTCCHTEIEAADQTFHLTQSQYTDTGPTSLSADPITPGAWQGSHWSANF